MIEYKVDWERELERRKALGIKAADPIPHPDQIMINFYTNQVVVKGPFTKEQKAAWDRFHEHLAECDDTIAELEALLKGEEHQDIWPQVQVELENEHGHRRRLAEIIEKLRKRWSL